MPISIAMMAVSIGTTVYSGEQQKKIASTQAFEQRRLINEQSYQDQKNLKDAYNQQIRLQLIGLSGDIAKNYQALELGKQQQLELQNQYQQYQYLKIGGIVLVIISVTYLFTKRP
jgi:hypothetical protein